MICEFFIKFEISLAKITTTFYAGALFVINKWKSFFSWFFLKFIKKGVYILVAQKSTYNWGMELEEFFDTFKSHIIAALVFPFALASIILYCWLAVNVKCIRKWIPIKVAKNLTNKNFEYWFEGQQKKFMHAVIFLLVLLGIYILIKNLDEANYNHGQKTNYLVEYVKILKGGVFISGVYIVSGWRLFKIIIIFFVKRIYKFPSSANFEDKNAHNESIDN